MSHTGPILEGKGITDYERYIRVPELLALQKTPDQLATPDEHLFQVTHQSAELWLKHIDFDVDRIAVMLEEKKAEAAADLFERSARIIDLLAQQVLILETMAAVDYHAFRVRSLGRGSGQESPGFQRLLTVGRRTWPAAEALFAAAGATPIEIEREPVRHAALYRLVRSMMNYDEAFMRWRFTHMKLAMRVIGSRVMSLKGVPVNQLEGGTREPLFPMLWETISDLTGEFKPEY